ncbi:hypothetical protein [Herbaspirillum sp. SJZ107]|uniref:hypothetical protein n=1 Tax=Herbaspirillum sp. SJZ107 TaxID=2572881 RepID=UPI001169FC5A|nr:hypothetical protein [Herbaspirillum sp. SJZ107]TQK10193.1 hypothetical protein FBX97_0109 [Herbaspirillum sp. SJZ107]
MPDHQTGGGKRWTKTEARQEARRYAAALLDTQDSPDWTIDAGLPLAMETVFMDELRRLAGRIRKTIKEQDSD